MRERKQERNRKKVSHSPARIQPNPQEAPEGMFSWFPLFLPLRRPPRLGGPGGGEGSQQQQAQQRLVVDVWRCCAPGRVWYEWAASAPGQPGALHNPAGRGSHVSTG